MVPALPPATLLPLAYTLAGCGLGTVSGLLPGLHANNFALLLAATAPALDAPPLALGCAMLSAGLVHTFLDVVPALALGVPDAAMAASALPGHRLVIEGRGREALRLSVVGSGSAVLLAVPVAVPLTAAMEVAYPTLRGWLPVLLVGVLIALLLTEPSWMARGAAAVAVALATGLGTVTLEMTPSGPLPAGGVLAPLFAGLFGAPILLDALDGGGIPPQADARIALERRATGVAAVAGTGAGAAVGYLPGVSAGVASTLALPFAGGDDPAREYLVATSGANTATAVFALFAFTALGTPRSGVLVAMSDVGVPARLPPLLVSVAVAAAVGVAGVLVLGDAALRAVGRLNQRALVGCVLVGLVLLSWGFAGGTGIVTFASATVVGFVPSRLGCKRVHLMAVLVGPLALGS
ncbi:tripartite tricarboxylate transporter permease [Halorarum halobium]|uniref:tripartite tricarboxylate transporter permease n=1 Tax=Halorarum halobium TaxID=3075121 RepID=UPI0028A60AC4|nr:tripartite tricarboxylate transporter permease [Halobaculum sp. XH14]